MNIQIGDKIERWTVLERISRNSRVYYLCECECGTKKEVRADHLKAGKSKSCGCLQREIVKENTRIDLTGQQFGHLTVIGLGTKPESNHQRGAYWQCQCICGCIIDVSSHTLRNGRTRSCGCIKSMGEDKIAKILLENKANFGKQFSFEDCLSIKGNRLYFDFIIYRNDGSFVLVEYQGEQHYTDDNWNWISPKENDQIKRDFCSQKNIELVEIPYWDFEKMDWNYIKEKCNL